MSRAYQIDLFDQEKQFTAETMEYMRRRIESALMVPHTFLMSKQEYQLALAQALQPYGEHGIEVEGIEVIGDCVNVSIKVELPKQLSTINVCLTEGE